MSLYLDHVCYCYEILPWCASLVLFYCCFYKHLLDIHVDQLSYSTFYKEEL